MALLCANADASTPMYPVCSDCHRCTQTAPGGGCMGQCVYDVNYCQGQVCEDGYTWNPKTQKCESTSAIFCLSGKYISHNTCVDCPQPSDFSFKSGQCSVLSDALSAGTTGIGSCMLPTTMDSVLCQYADTTGTFIFTNDCFHAETVIIEPI